jgi:hypothetical protein
MSFPDDTRALEQSFERTRDLLERLHAGLKARRAAWISVRPSTLAPSPELEQLTQDAAREEALRAGLLERIRRALPAPFGGDAALAHVNVTRIAAALPAPAARSLRDAADAVQRLAKAVRTEVTLGQRLVRFAQDAGERTAVIGRLGRGGPPGYDRGARIVRAGKAAGALVDGKV